MFWSPGRRHKMINKSKANVERKRKPKFIGPADIKRVKKMLPYFRRKKYKR
jgi:ribosomal protein L35